MELKNTPPEEQEGIYKALFDCNCDISEENRFVVPFIVAAAVPCGLLYKEHLELNPTVSDTFTALMNCSRTNQIAINMIMFALKMAGCCPVKMERIQETSSQSNDIHALEDDKIKQSVLFHKLLVDIINALPAELRRQVIYESSEYLSSNPVHTQMLHVHFLRLIQATVIGYRNVTKLHAMIESIRRPDILDDIDEYCREVGLPVLCRQGDESAIGSPNKQVQDSLTPVQVEEASHQTLLRSPAAAQLGDTYESGLPPFDQRFREIRNESASSEIKEAFQLQTGEKQQQSSNSESTSQHNVVQQLQERVQQLQRSLSTETAEKKKMLNLYDDERKEREKLEDECKKKMTVEIEKLKKLIYKLSVNAELTPEEETLVLGILAERVIKKSETEDLTCSDQVEPIPTAFTGMQGERFGVSLDKEKKGMKGQTRQRELKEDTGPQECVGSRGADGPLYSPGVSGQDSWDGDMEDTDPKESQQPEPTSEDAVEDYISEVLNSPLKDKDKHAKCTVCFKKKPVNSHVISKKLLEGVCGKCQCIVLWEQQEASPIFKHPADLTEHLECSHCDSSTSDLEGISAKNLLSSEPDIEFEANILHVLFIVSRFLYTRNALQAVIPTCNRGNVETFLKTVRTIRLHLLELRQGKLRIRDCLQRLSEFIPKNQVLEHVYTKESKYSIVLTSYNACTELPHPLGSTFLIYLRVHDCCWGILLGKHTAKEIQPYFSKVIDSIEKNLPEPEINNWAMVHKTPLQRKIT